MMITSTKLANFKIEQLEALVAQQAAVIEQMRDKFISIQEYWNRAHTQEAAVDACYHAINMAEEALALQPCPEVLNKVRAEARRQALHDAADDFEIGASADDIRCNAQRIETGEE